MSISNRKVSTKSLYKKSTQSVHASGMTKKMNRTMYLLFLLSLERLGHLITVASVYTTKFDSDRLISTYCCNYIQLHNSTSHTYTYIHPNISTAIHIYTVNMHTQVYTPKHKHSHIHSQTHTHTYILGNIQHNNENNI